MASSSWSASTTTCSRPKSTSYRAPRLRIALSFLLLLACLTSTVLAGTETSSSSLRHRRHHAPTINRYELHRRKDEDEVKEIVNKETPSKTEGKSKATTVTIQRAAKTAAATNTPLPEAFDGNLSAELSTTSDSNCPAFLNGILSDPSYETCYPLSMMLQTSRGFFEAQKQLLSIVRVLDATCAANVTYCTDFFDAAARNLTASENCKQEWESGNTIVKQFLYGMKAYEMMYKATCLQTPEDDMYCYANAVTNTTTAANAYFYYLPYNLTLPGSTNPSCSWCIQETMNIFHAAAEDRSQPVALTYESAARQVNTLCGPDFVNSTLPPEETNLAHIFAPSWVGLVLTLGSAALVNAVL
ncbi:hypothetical protein BKA60DRAFT_24999 [Fusarium oxysporum]|uniref:DUF7729 domain-containing protein n=1 Tax=Fusarium oxysporum TaxID=5507 RepID=A0A420NDD1_FUSOX|nr:hypothetical protein BKA60DRAFT_24999 [Fusarium oxysporum]RKK78294.1 hypothetical protein BFJ69_g5591 [Fusarium oxysporum]